MKGVYVLLISVCRQITVDIGKLGAVTFRKGFYAYVGSDQNNLEKRIARHLRRNKRIFWHIDYLLDSKYAKVADAFWKETGKADECETARKMSESGLLVPGFGCSDCSCKSHLFFLGNHVSSGGLRAFLEDNFNNWRIFSCKRLASSLKLQ